MKRYITLGLLLLGLILLTSIFFITVDKAMDEIKEIGLKNIVNEYWEGESNE
jgi:hypothetical protein